MNIPLYSKSMVFVINNFHNNHFTNSWNNPCPYHYIGCLISGTAEIETKNEKITVGPNEIFYIPKDVFYQSKWFSSNNDQIRFYSFGFEYMPFTSRYILQKIDADEKSLRLFDELCREIPMTEYAAGKLYSFLGEISPILMKAKPKSSNRTIELSTNYMKENPHKTIADVAKFCGVSESNLYSLYKKFYKESPNFVRQRILCEKATELLTTTDYSVEEICDILNFSSSSYFRKVLRLHTNKTPREIRKSAIFM